MSIPKFPQINQVAVSGVLANEPEYRQLGTGKAWIHFSVAVNRSYRDDLGEWKQETTDVPVAACDKLAEYVAERLQKGKAVFITGRLKSRTYEAGNGSQSSLEIVARNIQLLDKQKDADKEEESVPA